MKKWMKTALVLAAAVCLSVAAAFTALAAQTFQITASIGSCLIGSGQNTVDISLSSNGDTTGTDGKIYLFELRPYESEIGSRTGLRQRRKAGQTMHRLDSFKQGNCPGPPLQPVCSGSV